MSDIKNCEVFFVIESGRAPSERFMRELSGGLVQAAKRNGIEIRNLRAHGGPDCADAAKLASMIRAAGGNAVIGLVETVDGDAYQCFPFMERMPEVCTVLERASGTSYEVLERLKED